MWTDVAKFRHFCKIAKVVGLIFEGFSFIENFKPTEAKYAIGQIVIVGNGQILYE